MHLTTQTMTSTFAEPSLITTIDYQLYSAIVERQSTIVTDSILGYQLDYRNREV